MNMRGSCDGMGEYTTFGEPCLHSNVGAQGNRYSFIFLDCANIFDFGDTLAHTTPCLRRSGNGLRSDNTTVLT